MQALENIVWDEVDDGKMEPVVVLEYPTDADSWSYMR